MEIYLIRHGETQWNRLGRLQGTCDIPLNDAGIAGARKIARSLKDIDFDRAFSSPLVRALKTAGIILKYHPGLSLEIKDSLREISFGECEGISVYGEYTDENTEKQLDDLKNWFSDPTLPINIKGIESIQDTKKRADAFIKGELIPLEGECERVLLLSHGGIIKAITDIINDTPDRLFWSQDVVPNCGGIILLIENGKLSIKGEIDMGETVC